MRSRTSRGVPEWSEGKELYIGSAVSAIGKVSGSPGIVPGPPEGYRGSTGWGHLSQRAPWAEVGGEPAPSGLVRPPYRPNQGEKEREGNRKERGVGIRPPPFLPLPPLLISFPLRCIWKGGGRLGGGAQVGLLLLGAPLAAPLPLPPIYMWGAPLEHTTLIPSHVRRPLHSLRLRSYSRSA